MTGMAGGVWGFGVGDDDSDGGGREREEVCWRDVCIGKGGSLGNSSIGGFRLEGWGCGSVWGCIRCTIVCKSIFSKAGCALYVFGEMLV